MFKKIATLKTLIFCRTQQPVNLESEEDDGWEWDVNTKQVRLLEKRSDTGGGGSSVKYKEYTLKDEAGPQIRN